MKRTREQGQSARAAGEWRRPGRFGRRRRGRRRRGGGERRRREEAVERRRQGVGEAQAGSRCCRPGACTPTYERCTSTLMSLRRPSYSRATSLKMGAIMMHGPHVCLRPRGGEAHARPRAVRAAPVQNRGGARVKVDDDGRVVGENLLELRLGGHLLDAGSGRQGQQQSSDHTPRHRRRLGTPLWMLNTRQRSADFSFATLGCF